jgi:dihydrofolate reductase
MRREVPELRDDDDEDEVEEELEERHAPLRVSVCETARGLPQPPEGRRALHGTESTLARRAWRTLDSDGQALTRERIAMPGREGGDRGTGIWSGSTGVPSTAWYRSRRGRTSPFETTGYPRRRTMGIVIYDKSMSLDGFIAAANMRPDAGLGDDGERLHDWAFKDEAGLEMIEREVAQLGAVICGRTTYDMSIPYWGPDGPTGDARVPLFVLSHGSPDDVPEGGVYTFVGDPETALTRAREVADGRNIAVMGAETGRQLIDAGVVDEISIHVVPVLFGSGTPLFGKGVGEHVTLEFVGVSESTYATHLRYRVVRG